MSAAQEKHDFLLRYTMLPYKGLELSTEGDSFQVSC
jgi:hypothetical protein